MLGKCAWHFHQVSFNAKLDVIFDSFFSKLFSKISELSRNDINWAQPPQQTAYRVEGPINAIYTNILISRICDDFVDEPDY